MHNPERAEMLAQQAQEDIMRRLENLCEVSTMTKKIFLLLLVLSTLLVISCGFRPYQAKIFHPKLHAFYLQADTPYDPLAIAVKHTLKSSGMIF